MIGKQCRKHAAADPWLRSREGGARSGHGAHDGAARGGGNDGTSSKIHRGAHIYSMFPPYGDWDYLLPEYLRLTHEHLPNSELVIFQDSGHLPFWDAADR